MAPGQVAAVVGLLEIMLDPFARTLASAPYDDEPVSEEEAREIEECRAALARGEGIPHEDVLAEFGLTSEDFERMGRTPLKPNGSDK
jgi:mRNA interferase RelE/StbE